MYAITGITGKVGGTLANALLDKGLPVRAIVRDAGKGAAWVARGCEVAIADMADGAALGTAFADAEAVFILPPSEFDPKPGYVQAQELNHTLVEALTLARPNRVVCLSTIGADAGQDNLLTQRTLLEQALSALPLPVTFLRPAWFLENAAWDVASARDEGVIHSFLMPLDKPFAMVATADVGTLAAQLMQENWSGKRIIELEGPRRVSPNDLAAAFAKVLGRPVRAEAVPHESWDGLFRAQGGLNPNPRIRMLDGFNQGWIDFPDGGARAVKGTTDAEAVIAGLVHREAAAA
ncbi:MAG: NmrA family transcriptional regulator [Devosia sp.]|uniref:NmrA family NAD(P)-binding protein n=1 Tax=Devosia sp. TaxID=1871048 RepID=UPI002601D3CF|nr:NmrA family NAD(P)-binding protein [Devosia sp.]MDB5527119.1 NmrA family transcriptional regulator [Devosia sp.]